MFDYTIVKLFYDNYSKKLRFGEIRRIRKLLMYKRNFHFR